MISNSNHWNSSIWLNRYTCYSSKYVKNNESKILLMRWYYIQPWCYLWALVRLVGVIEGLLMQLHCTATDLLGSLRGCWCNYIAQQQTCWGHWRTTDAITLHSNRLVGVIDGLLMQLHCTATDLLGSLTDYWWNYIAQKRKVWTCYLFAYNSNLKVRPIKLNCPIGELLSGIVTQLL